MPISTFTFKQKLTAAALNAAFGKCALNDENNAQLSAGMLVIPRNEQAIATPGTYNNYNIAGVSHLRTTGLTGNITFTGFAGWVEDQILIIRDSSAHSITLANENSGSDMANRILTYTGADIVLTGQKHAVLQYDGRSDRMIVLFYRSAS